MAFVRFLASLILVASVASVSSFQTPKLSTFVGGSVRLQRNLPSFISLRAASDDETTEAGGEKSTEDVTDLDKATFEIAKEYAETGIPEDTSSDSPGLKVDTFSM